MPIHLFKKGNNQKYSEDQRRFSISLYACSKKAYEQVQSTLHLPDPRTIQRWLSHYDGSPGLLRNALDFLAEKLISKFLDIL